MTRALVAFALLCLVAVGALFALVLADWNVLRKPIEREVAARTGHPLTLGGDLRIALGRRLRITAEDVRIAAGPGAKASDFFAAQRVAVTLSWPALAMGRLDLHELELFRPRLALAPRPRADAVSGDRLDGRIRVRRLRIHEGTVDYADAVSATALELRVSAAGTGAPDDLKLAAEGTYRGTPLRATAAGPTALALAPGGDPYPFAADVRAGATAARLRGTVAGAAGGGALDVVIEVSGNDLAELGKLLDVALEATPPYRLSGRLRRSGAEWRIDDLAGRVGASTVAGEAAFSAHGRAPFAGAGDSRATLLGSADGRLTLAIDRGTVSNRQLRAIGLDPGETALLFAHRGDREIPLYCAVADLGLEGGIATANVLVLETADTLVVGAGVIDLRSETLDLTVHPRPKRPSALPARSPLHVRGPLRNPSVQPDAATAAGGFGAAALALANPLVALLPFVETGAGKDSDCARMVSAARDWARPTPEVRAAAGRRPDAQSR